MWPGRARSSALVAGSSSARTVAQRSEAEMPVLVPWRASTDTVNAVRCDSVLSATMSGRRSSSRRGPSTGMQITPLVWRIMNAIASGVIFSAAMMRSPSFSRSASSTTMTSSPRAIASTASSMSAKGMSGLLGDEQTLDVFGEDVDLEVDGLADVTEPERRHRKSVRDDGDGERVGAERGDGEAHAVDRHRPFLDDVAQHRRGRRDGDRDRTVGLGAPGLHPADPVDVALHEVTAEAVGEPD